MNNTEKLIQEAKQFLVEATSKADAFLQDYGFKVRGKTGFVKPVDTDYELVTDGVEETIDDLKRAFQRIGYRIGKEKQGIEYEVRFDANGKDEPVSFIDVHTSSPTGYRLPTISVTVFYE